MINYASKPSQLTHRSSTPWHQTTARGLPRVFVAWPRCANNSRVYEGRREAVWGGDGTRRDSAPGRRTTNKASWARWSVRRQTVVCEEVWEQFDPQDAAWHLLWPVQTTQETDIAFLGKTVTSADESVNDARINADQFLCLNCRIKLTKDPRSLPVLESSSNSSMIQDSDTSQECSESIGSSPSEAEISRQDTETVMPVLGISPLVTASKCKYNLPTWKILASERNHTYSWFFFSLFPLKG